MENETGYDDHHPAARTWRQAFAHWWHGYHGDRHNHQLCRFVAHNLAVELYAQAVWLAPGAKAPEIAQDLPKRIMREIARLDAGEDCASAYPRLLAWQPQLYLAAPDDTREQIFRDLCVRYHAMVNADEKPSITVAALLGPGTEPSPSAERRAAARDAVAVSLMSRIGQRTLINAEKNAVSGQIGGSTMWIAGLITLILAAIFLGVYFLSHAIVGHTEGVNASLSRGISPLATGGLWLICWMGVLGAFTSTIARLQKTLGARQDGPRLPLSDLDSLAANKISVALSLASGAVFALMAYLLFSSGAAGKLGLSDGLFPRMSPDSQFAVAALGVGYRPYVGDRWIIEAQRHQRLYVDDPMADNGDDALPPVETDPAGSVAPSATVIAEPPVPGSTPSAGAPTVSPEPVASGAATTVRRHTVTVAYVAPGARFTTPPPPVEPTACVVDAGPACGAVAVLALRLGLWHAEDLFKMLVWAFIAGFAERLLPDVIDRVLKRNVERYMDGKTPAPVPAAGPPVTPASVPATLIAPASGPAPAGGADNAVADDEGHADDRGDPTLG